MAASAGVLAACSGQAGTPSADTAEGSAPASTSSASPSPTPTAEPTPTAVAAVPPKIETKTVVEIRKIPFKKKTVRDSSVEKGKTVVTTRGVNGANRLTYRITLTDGVQTGKKLVREVVGTRPVTQITATGTKAEPEPAGNCDPNYSGGCVPVASDVDCAGGSGNGPAYARGPVTVVGSDIYDLDRDGDGVGCDD